ncbi:MAG: ferritin family protein [candidate division WOR-3 bacterium]|nr:ferritin family protein [candidate division WOR-3 bacterium]
MEQSKAIQGLLTALQTELNGIEFYKMAAEKTEDEKGKKAFQMLADDELKHFNAIQQQYKSLVDESKWTSVDLGNISIFEGESPIFTDDLKDRVQGKHFEVTALSIGAQLEANSIDFYRKMKEQSNDPTAKEMYDQLQKWEEVHLNAITRQLDLIKEDYWSEQRFSPLY